MFEEKMPNEDIVKFGITNNNMYFAEIRDKDTNLVESATLKASMAEIFKWINDHE